MVVDLFRQLGATFIKVGQIMSTRPDLIPEYVSSALAELQDHVGPFPFEDVVRAVEADLGRPLNSVYAEFAPVPIASASVAQVHKARLPDGRIVAVKVRRPDVVEICTFDLAVMRLWARLIARIPSISTLSPIETLDEFGRAVFAQLDFRIEASNNRRFRDNFKGHADVVFPDVVEALSGERVLTMSYIAGTKILSTRATRSDPKRVARLGLSTLMKMIFEDGFVHADLHPGNIFITPDDKLALLDLGLVGELDEPHRKGFSRLFAAWAQRDGDGMARIINELSAGSDPAAARSRAVRAPARRDHRVRRAVLGPAARGRPGRPGPAGPACHHAAPPGARERQLHHRQHRDRRDRRDRQAAGSGAGPHAGGPPLLPRPPRRDRHRQGLTRKALSVGLWPSGKYA